MTMAVLAVIPFGLVLFNFLATLFGGSLRIRAPMLFALGAISMTALGLASELTHSMVAVGWQLQNTTDATASTHYALGGAAVLGGLAALHYWYPKMTGRTLGDGMGQISFWTILVGLNLAFFPLFLAGLQGQVVDAYKYYSGTGVSADNMVATIGAFVLSLGLVLSIANAYVSVTRGTPAGHDPWGGETLEWFATSPPPPHNFDVVPDVRSDEPLRDIREAVRRHEASRPARTETGEPVA
jgi:heme/copper-type cytochrome/quinol oxidase subunit 1